MTYTWDFCDGSPVTITLDAPAILAHVYPAVGSYTATVTTTNCRGSVVETETITIVDVPLVGLALTSDAPRTLEQATTLTTTLLAVWKNRNTPPGRG